MTEVWRDIPGFVGSYQVSDMGGVRSVDRYVAKVSRKGAPFLARFRGKELRPGRMTQGHLSVAIGRGNSLCVHTLVLTAFRGSCPEGEECRHLNGVPADNRLSNLVWGSRGQNTRDDKWHGKMRRNYKLGVLEVREIKGYLLAGTPPVKVARLYGVSKATIYSIQGGKTHADVLP